MSAHRGHQLAALEEPAPLDEGDEDHDDDRAHLHRQRVGGRRLTFRRLDGVEPALNPHDPPVNPFQALVDLSDDLVQDQDLLACVDNRLVQGRR